MQKYVLQYFNVKQPILICIKRKINFKPFGFKIKYIFYNDSVTTKTFYHCLRGGWDLIIMNWWHLIGQIDKSSSHSRFPRLYWPYNDGYMGHYQDQWPFSWRQLEMAEICTFRVWL